MSERFPEIDLVGCNSLKRAAFNAGFGRTLKHYFVTAPSRCGRAQSFFVTIREVISHVILQTPDPRCELGYDLDGRHGEQ